MLDFFFDKEKRHEMFYAVSKYLFARQLVSNCRKFNDQTGKDVYVVYVDLVTFRGFGWTIESERFEFEQDWVAANFIGKFVHWDSLQQG